MSGLNTSVNGTDIFSFPLSVLKVKTNKNTEGTEVPLPHLGNSLVFNSETNRLYLKNGLSNVDNVDLSPLKGTKASVSGDTLVLA